MKLLAYSYVWRMYEKLTIEQRPSAEGKELRTVEMVNKSLKRAIVVIRYRN